MQLFSIQMPFFDIHRKLHCSLFKFREIFCINQNLLNHYILKLDVARLLFIVQLMSLLIK